MGRLNVFYQREGTREIEHLEVDPDATFAALRALLVSRHGFGEDVVVFLEDVDEAAGDERRIDEHAGRGGVKVHVHRCRRIETLVSFNGQKAERHFGPGTTVARVKKWAADHFHLSPEDASEHVLQIAGTHDRPPPGTHLGSLAACPDCRVRFDLVPDHRVNGSS